METLKQLHYTGKSQFHHFFAMYRITLLNVILLDHLLYVGLTLPGESTSKLDLELCMSVFHTMMRYKCFPSQFLSQLN